MQIQNTINPYNNVITRSEPIQPKEKVEKIEPSREEIIQDKNMSPEDKLKALGIELMNTDQLAEKMADYISGNLPI